MTDATRAPGRPRSAEADAAIFDATLDLLREVGYRSLSVEAVRQRAGVGKATIYRRFPDKEALVKAAIASLKPQVPALPDTGTLRGDLAAAFRAVYGAGADVKAGTFAVLLLAEATADPALHELFRQALIEPRRDALRELLGRGVERGELPRTADLELGIDLLAGPVIYRTLIEAGDLDGVGRRLDGYVDTVLAGLSRRA